MVARISPTGSILTLVSRADPLCLHISNGWCLGLVFVFACFFDLSLSVLCLSVWMQMCTCADMSLLRASVWMCLRVSVYDIVCSFHFVPTSVRLRVCCPLGLCFSGVLRLCMSVSASHLAAVASTPASWHPWRGFILLSQARPVHTVQRTFPFVAQLLKS